MAQDYDLGGNNLIVNSLKVGASGPGQTGTDIGTTDLTALAGVTAGTVTASKALIVDASKNLSTFGTVGATIVNSPTVNAGADAVAGTIAIFPTTTATGKTTLTASSNSGATTTNINTAAQAGARTLTIPDAGASTANFVLSTGTSTATTATSTELNTLHGVTPGTVIASSAIVTDSGTKITGLLNNTYGAGTATVAPIVLTSGTNLTTATAGAVEFDGNAFYATSQASSRQMVDAEQYIIQATQPAGDNNGGLDSNAAAAVFTAGSGTITLVAGKTYFFEGQYMLTNSGTTSHTWATAFGGTATFTATGTAYSVAGNSSGTANAAATGGLTGFLTGATLTTPVVCTAASTSATEQVLVQVYGTLVVANAGTLIPQMKASARPGASGTPGVVHVAGSFFRIWQAPTLGTVGNWS